MKTYLSGNHVTFSLGHHFNLFQMTGLLAKKKDGKMAYKVALLSQDYSLQVIHKTGRIFTEALERSVVAQW